MIEYILYHSRCTHRDFSITDLDILRVAMAANSEHQVTGFLHREAGFYVQYYEGCKSKVDQLTQNLQGDNRHYNFTILSQGQTPERLFSNWSMGYSGSTATTLGLEDSDDAAFGCCADGVTRFLQTVAMRQV